MQEEDVAVGLTGRQVQAGGQLLPTLVHQKQFVVLYIHPVGVQLVALHLLTKHSAVVHPLRVDGLQGKAQCHAIVDQQQDTCQQQCKQWKKNIGRVHWFTSHTVGCFNSVNHYTTNCQEKEKIFCEIF